MKNRKWWSIYIREAFSAVLLPTVQICLIFFVTGKFNIKRIWIYYGVVVISNLLIVWYVLLKNIAGIKERQQNTIATRNWDKIIISFFFLISVFISPVIMGLDIRMNKLTFTDLNMLLPAIILYIAGYFIYVWAISINQHFEATVRIQTERSHSVVSKGPYRLIRHPGYIGTIAIQFAIPLIIGSLYGLIPAFFIAFLFVLRTWLEDLTLRRELAGYCEYAEKVKYRLVPKIW